MEFISQNLMFSLLTYAPVTAAALEAVSALCGSVVSNLAWLDGFEKDDIYIHWQKKPHWLQWEKKS